MKIDQKKNWKDTLHAILLGVIVAFLSSFFDGISQMLQNNGNDVLGGITATMTYLSKRLLS